MANKSWLKGAEAHRGQKEMEDHKKLVWQAPITKYQSAKPELRQKMIMNTRYVYPLGNSFGIKRP